MAEISVEQIKKLKELSGLIENQAIMAVFSEAILLYCGLQK